MDELNGLTLTELRKLSEYRSLPPKYKKTTLKVAELREAIYNERIQETKFTCKDTYELSKDELIDTMRETLVDYYKHGPRSSKKIDVLHFFINCVILQELRKLAPELIQHIRIYSQPFREAKVKGMLYDKDVDITVSYKRKHVGIISVKFITSNYKQNANNYFESMLGETINLKNVDGKPRIVWYSMFSFNKVPYYTKNNDLKHFEKIDIAKYKLLWEYGLRHKTLPDCISITLLNNTDNIKHPNNVKNTGDDDIRELVNDILPGGYNESAPLEFYPQLKIFCKKVVELLNQKYVVSSKKRVSGIRSNSV